MLRILSDLHFLDAASRIDRLDRLGPLLEGVDHLVLNGDTCDTETGSTPDQIADIKAFFSGRVPETTYITGNHDPAISNVHELQLNEDRIWITHGDVLFDDVVPWSRMQPLLLRRTADFYARVSDGGSPDLRTRLRAHRHACEGLPREFDPTSTSVAARVLRLAATLFPPRQLLAMVRAWRDTPRLAAALALLHRPAARIIINGHIHYPRVWRQPQGRVVINTGAFTPPGGALCVDLEADRMEVRKVVFHRGHFRPGRVITAIPLAAREGVPLSGTA